MLEFLGLRDEYSETDLEEGLIRQLETFLLELGNDFAFVGRQRRLRIDDEWYRVDLLFFYRRLRCLVIFDLKLGRFTHADAGQMHLYLNYARENWVQPGENPPVGVILCSGKSEALVRYATDSLPNKLLVREYLTALPDEKVLAAELEKTRKQLGARKWVWDKILLISQNAHEMRSADGGPTYTCQGQPAEPRGRFALGPRFVPNRSARIGTGAEPPHTREPAARCELRQLAVRKSPVMRLHQEEFCLTPRGNEWTRFSLP